MTQELIHEESNKKAIFKVINEGNKPIAVQASLTKRLMNEDGHELNPDADEEFIIFPDQLIVKPKEKRAIQVTYIGEGKVEVERAFRFVAEQLPIDVQEKGKKKNNIKILLKYRAAFYLTPPEAKSNVILNQPTPLVDKGFLDLSLENSGNKHVLLKDFSLVFEGAGKRIKKKFSEFKEIFGENLLAKNKRTFKIKVPSGLEKEKNLKVSLINK